MWQRRRRSLVANGAALAVIVIVEAATGIVTGIVTGVAAGGTVIAPPEVSGKRVRSVLRSRTWSRRVAFSR